MSIKKVFIIIAFLLLSSTAHAEKTDLGFGDDLIELGEYNNATLAYERAYYFSADALTKNKIKLKLAKAYYLSDQFDKSETLLNELIEGSATYKKQAQLELAKQFYEKKYYDFAAIEYNDYSKVYKDDEALYLSGWAYLKGYQYDKAAQIFEDIGGKKDSDYSFASLQLKDAALAGKELPQKNVGLAQFFSYILPGSGQMYSENWGDGMVSFLINALTISLFSNAINDNQTGEALIWLTLETAWYFGGVYSAGNSAIKYNKRVKNKQVADLELKYNIDKLIE